MMTGYVNAKHVALMSLIVLGPSRRELEIEAIIDTGFNGALTLPPSLDQQVESSLADPGQGDTGQWQHRSV